MTPRFGAILIVVVVVVAFVIGQTLCYYLPNHGVESGTQSAARDNRRLALFGHDFLVMIVLLQFYAFILRANRDGLMAAGSTNPVETLRGWCKD